MKDKSGLALADCYWNSRATATNLLTRDGARRIASNNRKAFRLAGRRAGRRRTSYQTRVCKPERGGAIALCDTAADAQLFTWTPSCNQSRSEALISKKVLPPAAMHAYHHRVIQKAENSNGKNSRTAEQRATEEAHDVVVCSVTVLICGPGRHFQVDWRIGKTAHSTRTEIIEAGADNTDLVPTQLSPPSIWPRCLLPSRGGGTLQDGALSGFRGLSRQLWEAGRL